MTSNLVINKNIINTLGLKEAVIIGEMINLINQNEYSETNCLEDKYWINKTYKSWNEDIFPYFSESTIKRIFTNLESIGILLKKDNENKFDRTLNITIDFERLNEIVFAEKDKK